MLQFMLEGLRVAGDRGGGGAVSWGQDKFNLNTKMKWGLLGAKLVGLAAFGFVLVLLPFG